MANGIANIWVWIGFSVFLVAALLIDGLVLRNPKLSPHHSLRTSIVWTLIWVISALLFNVLMWRYLLATTTPAIANEKALNFLTGYIIEKSLSVDNLFVFYLIFKQFQIPDHLQQRVFSYGIWSAVILRLAIILIGTWLINQFHWIIYILGAFLVLTGIRMVFVGEEEKDLTESQLYNAIKRFFRVTHEYEGKRFFIRRNKLIYATPLFVALVFIEFSDIVFAFDSIPAIFAITTDPFIVWTSNIFAILGMRALYFFIAGIIRRFDTLKYAIAIILVFVGCKMLISHWYKIPVQYSLAIILGTLITFGLLNTYAASRRKHRR